MAPIAWQRASKISAGIDVNHEYFNKNLISTKRNVCDPKPFLCPPEQITEQWGACFFFGDWVFNRFRDHYNCVLPMTKSLSCIHCLQSIGRNCVGLWRLIGVLLGDGASHMILWMDSRAIDSDLKFLWIRLFYHTAFYANRQVVPFFLMETMVFKSTFVMNTRLQFSVDP